MKMRTARSAVLRSGLCPVAILALASFGGAQTTAPDPGPLLRATSGVATPAPRSSVQYVSPEVVGWETITGVTTIVLEIGGLESRDLLGDADNVVLTLPLSEGDALIGIGWDVSLETIGDSFLSQAEFYIDGSDQDEMGVFIQPGAGDTESGSEFYSSVGILDLAEAGIPEVPVLADGNLFIELFERIDNLPNAADANWVGSSRLTLVIREAPQDCSPKLLGGAFSDTFAQDVASMDGYAYVADSEGLNVFDISDPLNPTLVASEPVAGLVTGIDVGLVGAVVVSQLASGSRITKFDVTDPEAPSQTGFLDFPGEAYAIVLVDGLVAFANGGPGEFAVVANGTLGVELFDVDGDTPQGGKGGDTSGLATDVDFDPSTSVFVVADYQTGITIFAEDQFEFDTSGLASGVVLAGDIVYVADYDNGLISIDLSNPAVPVLLDTLDTPGFADDVILAGNRAYVADRVAGVHVVDISDPSNLVLLGSVDTPSSAQSLALASDGALNLVRDPSFEEGIPNPEWTESSTNFGTPLCTAAICGVGGGTGANTGDWWVWFGGVTSFEASSISQDIRIPADATQLTFSYEIPVASGNGTDFLDISIDGVVLETIEEAEGPFVGYVQDSIDISAFADGLVHTLELSSVTDGAPNAFTNFFVDDVAILGGARVLVADFQSGLQIIDASSCDPPTPLSNDECINAFPIDCNSTIIADNSDATVAVDDPGLSCHFSGPGTQGENSIWYRFVAETQVVRVTTNGSVSPADDSLLGIYSGTCGALTEIGCSEDEGDGLLSDVTVGGLNIGETYYIALTCFALADAGEYMLTLECLTPMITEIANISDGLEVPVDAAVAPNGNVYVAGNTSNNVLEITPAGVVTEVANSTDGILMPTAVTVDSNGDVYVACRGNNTVQRISGGTVTQILDQTAGGAGTLSDPSDVAVDGDGNLFVLGNGSNNVFRRTPAGMVEEVLDSTANGMGSFTDPGGLAVDDLGNLYATGGDSDNAFRVEPGGTTTEIIDSTGDGANALASPSGVAVDGQRNVYVAGGNSSNVFKIDAGGPTEVLDSTDVTFPSDIEVDLSGTVYIAGENMVRRYTPSGDTSVAIGPGGDGTNVLLGASVAVADDGTVIVPGAGSDNVFRIRPDERLFPYNGSGVNTDYLEADLVVIGNSWTATLTPHPERGNGPWIILLRDMQVSGPTFDLGVLAGLDAAGLSELLVTGAAIANFTSNHSGGGSSSTFTTNVPNMPALIGSPWFIQAVVIGDLPDAQGGLGAFDPRLSNGVGGIVQDVP